MRFDLKHIRLSLIVCLAGLMALSGCGQNPPSQPHPVPAKGADDQTGPAGVPKGTPVNDPVWHASGGTATLGSLPPAKKDEPEDLLRVEPDVKLKAAELVETLKKGGFQNKVFEVTGVVNSYDLDSNGNGCLILNPLNPGIIKLDCGAYPMAKAAPGQTVTLRARYKPNLGLHTWTIVRVEGDPPVTITTEQLIADLKKDAEGTAKKYRGKYIIVTGQIRKTVEDRYTVYLTEPGAKHEIVCSIGSLGWKAAERNKWLEIGKPVRVMGQSLHGDGSLSGAVILPPNP